MDRVLLNRTLREKTMSVVLITTVILATHAAAHSGGLNKKGCHGGSQPYHCHRAQGAAPSAPSGQTVLTGKVTHIRDGDTIEVNGIPISLSSLDCPERGTQKGDNAARIAQQFLGSQATCELTGAKTYDRLVGYCEVNGADFAAYMVNNSSCRVWEKYDV